VSCIAVDSGLVAGLGGGGRTHAGEALHLSQPFRDDDPTGRLDQGEVGEGLGEVSEVAPGRNIEFFGVEPERRRNAEETLHPVACLLHVAHHCEGRNEPE